MNKRLEEAKKDLDEAVHLSRDRTPSKGFLPLSIGYGEEDLSIFHHLCRHAKAQNYPIPVHLSIKIELDSTLNA
jgi:hypothetical protein